MSKTVCDPANLAKLATNAVVASGGNLSAYARKVFMFPRNACAWSGLGDVADDMGNIAPAQFRPFAKAVKIPRGLDSSGRKRWCYLEYRQPIGADRHCQRPSPPSEYRVVWQLPPPPLPTSKAVGKAVADFDPHRRRLGPPGLEI